MKLDSQMTRKNKNATGVPNYNLMCYAFPPLSNVVNPN